MQKKLMILSFVMVLLGLGAMYWYVLHLRRDKPEDAVRVDTLLAQALREYNAGNTEAFLRHLRDSVTRAHWYSPDVGLLRANCRALQAVNVVKYPEANCLALKVIIYSARAHSAREPAIYYQTVRACFSVLEDKIKSCDSRAYSLLKGHFDTASREFKAIRHGSGVLEDTVYVRRVESLARRKLEELRRICDDIQKAM